MLVINQWQWLDFWHACAAGPSPQALRLRTMTSTIIVTFYYQLHLSVQSIYVIRVKYRTVFT